MKKIKPKRGHANDFSLFLPRYRPISEAYSDTENDQFLNINLHGMLYSLKYVVEIMVQNGEIVL